MDLIGVLARGMTDMCTANYDAFGGGTIESW